MRPNKIQNKRLYTCWKNMRQRCTNTKRPDAKYYSLKGVRYCPEWDEFDLFAEWALSHGYAENMTLDRIDPNKDYSPDNCRWITIAEQQRNRTCCNYLTFAGETKTLTDWAKSIGMKQPTLYNRIVYKGQSIEDIINEKGVDH